MFKSYGRLRYSPTNNGKLERRDGGNTKWWLVIDCHHDIGRYYRELYNMFYNKTIILNNPAWSAHISIISNEKPLNKNLWKKYEGKWLEFEYSHVLENNGLYFWLPVVCKEALDLREELGLNRDPFHALHLTIGNTK